MLGAVGGGTILLEVEVPEWAYSCCWRLVHHGWRCGQMIFSIYIGPLIRPQVAISHLTREPLRSP